jgi:DNA-binding NarL/FixJ family response regulator
MDVVQENTVGSLNCSTIRRRILIADHHCAVAEGIRSVLEKKYDVVGIVGDGRQLLIEAPKLKPDLILLDIGMPSLNGLVAAERLKPLLPNVKFVFLTMSQEPNLAAAGLNLGAVGYVLKHSAAAELLNAVAEILQGRSYVTPKLQPGNRAAREARARSSQRS